MHSLIGILADKHHNFSCGDNVYPPGRRLHQILCFAIFRRQLAPLPVEEDRERDAARPPHRTLHQDVGVGRAEPLRARQVGEAAFVEHGAAAAALVTLADHAQELGVAPAVTDHGLSGETSAGHNETLSSLLARSLLILLNILLTRSRWRRGCF